LPSSISDIYTNIKVVLALPNPSMPTAAEDRTSDFRLTERDLEGDLDMTVREEELDEMGRPLIDWVKPIEWLLPNAEVYEEWEEDEEDEDVDFIDLYESADEDGNGSEDSDGVYGEEGGDTEEEEEEEEEEKGGGGGQ
jgi:hypothetical protein